MIPLNDTLAKNREDRILNGLFFLLFTVPWVVLESCAQGYAFALLGRPWFLAYCSSSQRTENLSGKQGDKMRRHCWFFQSSASVIAPRYVPDTCPSSPSSALCTRAAPPADCWRSAEGTEPRALDCGSSGGTNKQGWKSDLLLWQPGLLHWWRHHTSPLLQLWGVDKEQHGEFPCSTRTGAGEADRRH